MRRILKAQELCPRTCSFAGITLGLQASHPTLNYVEAYSPCALAKSMKFRGGSACSVIWLTVQTETSLRHVAALSIGTRISFGSQAIAEIAAPIRISPSTV